jgi:D-cysteine desulfhydrase
VSRALFALFDRLRLPWVDLGRFPTPVEPLDGAAVGDPEAELWVKRDDLSSEVYGGNKVRTLEALFGRARAAGRREIWATGAFGSNHATATVLLAPTVGLTGHAMLWPQVPSQTAVENLRVVLGRAGRFVRLPHWSFLPASIAWARRDRRAFVMLPGGAVPEGAVAYVSAALEVALQVKEGACPLPRRVALGVGSTCTTAGLLLGFGVAARLGLVEQAPTLLAVRVTPWPVTAPWRIVDLAVRVGELLAEATGDRRFAIGRRALAARLSVEGRALGRGYGAATGDGIAALHRFRARGGPPLDTTYSAKAVAGITRRIAEGRLPGPTLYWATKSSAPLPEVPGAAPRLARWIRRAEAEPIY